MLIYFLNTSRSWIQFYRTFIKNSFYVGNFRFMLMMLLSPSTFSPFGSIAINSALSKVEGIILPLHLNFMAMSILFQNFRDFPSRLKNFRLHVRPAVCISEIMQIFTRSKQRDIALRHPWDELKLFS